MKTRTHITNYGMKFDFIYDLIIKHIDCRDEDELLFLECLLRKDTEEFETCDHLLSVMFSEDPTPRVILNFDRETSARCYTKYLNKKMEEYRSYRFNEMDFNGGIMDRINISRDKLEKTDLKTVTIITENAEEFTFDDVIKIVSPSNKDNVPILKLYRENGIIFSMNWRYVKYYNAALVAPKS